MLRDRNYTDRPAARDFRPLPGLTGRQLAWTVAGVLLAMFLAMLNQTSLTTAMPSIIVELGGFDRYAWASAAYLVAATISAPVAGRLADLYGHRDFLILGLSVFILGSILAGLSSTMTQLIAFRCVQGLGGGIIVVSCLVAIVDLFPPDRRGKIQGLAALVFGIAAVIGPPLGGLITDTLSWNWVLLINIPAGIPILLLAMKLPRTRSGKNILPLDYPGMLTLILAVLSILLALAWGGTERGWGSPVVQGSLAFGLVMAAAFVLVELKSEAPIMPIGLFRNHMAAASVALNFLAGFGLYGTVLFAPLFFQAALSTTATGSGGVLTPMMLGIVFGGILTGVILSLTRAHYRFHAVFSSVALTGGMFLVATLHSETGLGLAMIFFAIAGFGIGGAFATANAAVQRFVPQPDMAVTTSTLQFYRYLSGTLGLAFLGSVLNSRFSTRLDGLISDSLRNSFSPAFFDQITQNLRILLDPAAAEDLAADFATAGSEGAGMVEELSTVLNDALVGSIQDVFMITMAVTAVAIVAGLFLKHADETQ